MPYSRGRPGRRRNKFRSVRCQFHCPIRGTLRVKLMSQVRPAYMSNTDDKATQLATTLRRARETSGLSVRQLQAVSGVAKSVISRFEHEGTGSAHNLLALARALELRASDLFSQAGRPLPRPAP